MEIRGLSTKDYRQAKALWKTCFGDSDAFIDTYFQYAAPIEKSLGLFSGGALLSDLFMLDFKAVLSGAVYHAPFLAGCATLPEARKKDYMRTLIKQALTQMKARGIAVTFLHPFLHAFYRKFGYGTVAYVKTRNITSDARLISREVRHARAVEQAPLALLARSYTAFISGYDNYFARGAGRMDAWVRLLFSDGGVLSYIAEGETAAYAMYYVRGDTAEIFELVYFDEAQKQSLLHSTGAKNVTFRTPAPAGEEEFTMMRALDPARLLAACPMKERAALVLYIEDSFLETEYRLAVEAAGGANKVAMTDAPPDFSMDIGTLAQLVAGSCLPEGQKQLCGVFAPKISCYFEQY
ncbi:MAG TPA: hypothetical protein DEB31_03230 [Clostridiales bacterium]|nr:hypothetical protein [Clostridiales bacterium]